MPRLPLLAATPHRRSSTAAVETAARGTVPALLLTLAMVLAMVLAMAPPAGAHGGAGVLPVLEDVTPGLPGGVELSVAGTAVAALLELQVSSDRTVEVPDSSGTAWLRIAPAGVEVDAGLPETYRSTNPEGGGIPSEVAAGMRPRRWVQVSSTPRWAWFEHRLHPGDGQAAARWEVPLRLNGRTHVARGSVEQPAPATGRVTAALRRPAPEGVAVDLLPGTVPGVLVRLDGADEVVVRGTAGEPYLRFTPDGVAVNVRSQTYRDTELARGSTGLDALAPARGVEWQPASGSPSYAWPEPRARAPLDLPEDVRTSDRVRDLLTWEVPLEVDGRALVLAGVTRWTPGTGVPRPGGEDGQPWIVLALAAAGIGLTATVLILRRRRVV